MEVRRALLSVHDKTGLVPFARFLAQQRVELWATLGTAKALRSEGLAVRGIEEITGQAELLDGRVKTLNPRLLAAILAVRANANHMAQLRKDAVPALDLVAVNLYPFEQRSQELATADRLPELIDEIDIGGVTLLRAAAKNHQDVAVASSPDDYEEITRAWDGGGVPLQVRRRLALRALGTTAVYDGLIATTLRRMMLPDEPFPAKFAVPLVKQRDLRYGENNHQRAAYYRDASRLFDGGPGASSATQLQGRELSYNNLLDADSAVEVVKDFDDPTVAIVKHATPAGIASADTVLKAWHDAYATDTKSPYGGVVAMNRACSLELAHAFKPLFLEMVLAPGFAADALDVLKTKKNLRVLQVSGLGDKGPVSGFTMRTITGGALVQDKDWVPVDTSAWKVVTKRAPTDDERRTMVFATKAVKHVRSNALVLAKGTRTIALGGGQTARVDASWIAVHKAGANAQGSCMASDAFFPFPDAVEVAAQAGVTSIVQPGGSIRDAEVIATADQHAIAMVFTGRRAFRH